MDDFISRKALLERLDNRTRTAYPNELYGLMLAHDYISDAPAVETGSKWIPVTERLPELHGDFITAIAFEDGDILIDISYWYGKCWETLSGEKCNVTHWMPLPEPPKEGAEDG